MTPKTLVVPLDGSPYAERALPIAEAVAERIGGGLLLVSARYHGPLDPRQYLEEQAALRDRCPVDLIATTEETYAAEIIADAVTAGEDRVVCMTTHGRGGVRWAALGSVAEDVIGRTDRPILLVGRNCRPESLDRSRLLVCADGSDECPKRLAPAARDWAQMLGLEVHVGRVTHPLDVDSAERSDVLLDELAAQFGVSGRSHATIVRSRFVAGALADLADDLPAAIAATHSHARRGLNRFALGSVTMGVVHLASCPVLVTHVAV
jgi:nucleotide-binding universal stress UspA family protein